MADVTIGGGAMQVMPDPYKAAVEKQRSEVYLRAQIAEQTTSWIHRFGAPRVLAAMREWLDYMDRVATGDGAFTDGEVGDG